MWKRIVRCMGDGNFKIPRQESITRYCGRLGDIESEAVRNYSTMDRLRNDGLMSTLRELDCRV